MASSELTREVTKMVSKILVPVDGSVPALRALEHAGWRKQFSAGDVSIVVLNVQAPLPPSRYVTRTMLREHHTRTSRQALQSARTASRRLKLDAKFYWQQGDAGATIARFAKKTKCTEIIMGTRGRGRVAAFVLGSVATRVVQVARMPVTLVK
jgi:nucleotide-binding universal stress UspA family protein